MFVSLSFLCFLPLKGQTQSVKELYEQAVEDYNNGRLEKAAEEYRQITQMMPSFAPAYNGLGLTVKGISGDDEAIHYFKEAVHYDPNFAQAYDNLGRIYYSRQDFNQAKDYFEKALKIDPQLPGPQATLGWIHLLAKSNPGKAVSYLKQALKLNPTPNTYFGLGLAYFADNRRVEAMEIITRLKEMKEDELASRLEKSLRESRNVQLDPVIHAVNKPAAGSSPAKGAALPAVETSAPDKEVPAIGVRVRLRGKLSDP